MRLLNARILLKVGVKTEQEINHMINHMSNHVFNLMTIRMIAHMENGNGNRNYNGF